MLNLGTPFHQPRINASLYFVLALTFCNTADAEIYKWVDENGKVHFGDRPPGNAKAEDIENTLNKINVSTDLSNPGMIQRAEQAKREERDKIHQKRAQKAKTYQNQAKKWCKEAKKRLHNLQGRVRFYDDDGKDVHVSEKERRQMEQDLKAELARKCK